MPEIIPFSTDLEAMEAELSWVEARIHRIQTQHRLHALIEGREVFMHHEKPLNRGTLERLLRKQTATETELRQTIDARRALSETALDQLCDSCGLTGDERSVLLLCAAPAFSKALESLVGSLDDPCHGRGFLSVEAVFNFLDFSMSERILARAMFGKRGALMENELIVLGLHDRYSEPEQLLRQPVADLAHLYLAGGRCLLRGRHDGLFEPRGGPGLL